MAIYNPRRARELEAAARLAESQRQRELAKGQREQRTTEQILGLVEGLIGAAPQAAQAFEQSQAERVLAGERPLEMEEAKDPFTSLGRFLFEPGIKAKAQKMAQERAPAELARLRPLATEAIKQTTPLDMPIERKEISKEEFEKRLEAASPAFGQKRAEAVLAESPIMQLLSEQQRKAMAAGETQRVQAEAEAAERQSKLDEAQITKLTSGAGLKVGDKDKKKIAELTPAMQNAAQRLVLERKEPLTSTDGKVQVQALDEIQAALDENLRAMGEDPYSAASQAVKLAVIEEAQKGIEMKPLNAAEVEKLVTQGETLRELVQLDALRKRAGWNPSRAEIIRQKIAEELESPISLIRPEKMLELALGVENRLKLSADERAFLNKASIMRNRAALAEFAGTGPVGDKEASRVLPFVLNPWTTDVEWDKDFSITLQSASSRYGQHVRALRATNIFDENIVNLGKMALEYGTTDTQEDSIKKSLKQSKEQIEAPADTERPPVEYVEQEMKEYTRGALEPAASMYGGFLGLSPKDFEEYSKIPAVSEALEVLGKFLPSFASSQQQMEQTQPTAAPPPQDPEDMEPEVKYLQLRQQNQIDPQTQDLIIITNKRGTFYRVIDKSETEQKMMEIQKRFPGATTQVYAGNVGGGL